MIHLYLWVVLWIWDMATNPSARFVNQAIADAQQAYESGEYLEAAMFYKQVVDASIFSDPSSRLNLANSLLLAGEEEEAYSHYKILSRVDNPGIAATAKSKMGMIALARRDTVEALRKLREAILLDRTNLSIVADFEVLRYRFSGEIDDVGHEIARNEKQDSLSRPVESAPAPEVMENTAVELSDQREQLLRNLDKINMSEEQAQAILDAMKANERQYIYQLRRLGARNSAKPSPKIEW